MFEWLKKRKEKKKKERLLSSLSNHYVLNTMVPVSWRIIYLSKVTEEQRVEFLGTYLEDLKAGRFGGVPEELKNEVLQM